MIMMGGLSMGSGEPGMIVGGPGTISGGKDPGGPGVMVIGLGGLG